MKKICFSELDPKRLDKQNGIVYGVSVCACGPAKGHGLTVTKTTLAQLYNAAQVKGDKIPVKLDHRSGLKEVAGFLTDFHLDGDKLRANWHLLKNQSNFSHTWETIEKLHDVCGLSCSFTGESRDGIAVCEDLISCDFVPHPATGNGLFSRGDLDFDALNENSDQNESTEDIPMEDMDSETIGELIHELLDHVEDLTSHIEQIEAENAAMAEALGVHQDDEDGSHDEDEAADAPVIAERGARSGPHDYSADLRTFDFESAIEENRRSGMDQRSAHIAALKSFARSKYQTLNL